MTRPLHTSAALGAFAWVVAAAVLVPNPTDLLWGKLLLLLAAFVIVPLGMTRLTGRFARAAAYGQFPAAALLAFSFTQPPSPVAAGLAMPWLGVLSLLAVEGVIRIGRHGLADLPELLVSSAFVMVPVGGAWAVADRFGYRPLDFDPVIVFLTAVHFHYAGFALPLLAGDALAARPGRVGTISGWLILLGVPLVATGITTTKLGMWGGFETIAALVLAAGGMTVAWTQWQSVRGVNEVSAILLRVSSVCLFVSLLLAVWYAVRLVLPVTVPDIPFMRATHGTLNAFGFALCGVLGRGLARREPDAEFAALALGTFHIDPAAVGVHDGLADGEAQARAARAPAAGLVHAEEAFEEPLAVGRRNAEARVGHGEGDAAIDGVHGDADLSPGRVVRDRVRDQIRHELA
jgi:hypothetical protein